MSIKRKLLIPTILSLIFIIIFSIHTIQRHLSFNSHGFDLGIYTQAIYLYSQGQLLSFSTLKHMILLADHFGPILLLLSPIYKVFPSAISLLIIQAVFVSLSSIPIYLIALDKLKNISLSILITLTYLTSQGIIAAITFDFHLATISILPLSLILYCLNFRHWRAYWIGLFLSLLFKEDLSIFILGLGAYEIIIRQYRIGLITIISAFTSFYLIKFKIMPFLWPGVETSYISSSILPLDSPIDLFLLIVSRPGIIWGHFFNSPIKLSTIDTLLKPFVFLSILSPLFWFTVIPYLFLRFTSTYYQMWSTSFHHNVNLIPFLAVSMIYAISRFKIPIYPLKLLIIFLLFTGSLSPNSFIWPIIQKPIKNFESFQYINNSLKKIPSYAAVSAQSPLVPHLANREKIYMYPEIYDAEYLILDTSLSSYPLHSNTLKENVTTLKKSSMWKVLEENRSLIIFKRF